MLDKDLERLWPILHDLWKIEGNLELGRTFVGYERRDPETHEIIHRKHGMFYSYSVTEVIDASRDWAIEHPGGDPRAYDGRGWKQIKHMLQQGSARQKRSPKVLEDDLVEEHRKHYAGCAGWEYPGDEFIRECIRRRMPTPLQRHCIAEIRDIGNQLATQLSAEQAQRRREAEWEKRDAARRLILREQMEQMYASGRLARPPELAQIVAKRAADEERTVPYGCTLPFGSALPIDPEPKRLSGDEIPF